MTPAKKVRILSLDGGGMRGIIPATVIKYVEKKLIEVSGNKNSRIADYFDLIVGTSTGGILTCFYLMPPESVDKRAPTTQYTASEALDFYVNKGYEIFNASKFNKWGGLRTVINSTRFSATNIERIFKETFGNATIAELIKPCLVTAYNLNKKQAIFFNSREPEYQKRNYYVRDVVRSTSAAPTYFAPAKIKNIITGERLVNVDGGVFANNPAMCAYAEACDMDFDGVCPEPEDIMMLSIGTGGGTYNLPNLKKSADWSVLKWAKSIPDIMMDGSIEMVNYQMKNMFSANKKEHLKNYKRINVPLNKRNYSPDMADASPENIQALQQAGQNTLNAALEGTDNELGLDDFIEVLAK